MARHRALDTEYVLICKDGSTESFNFLAHLMNRFLAEYGYIPLQATVTEDNMLFYQGR